MAGAAAVTAVLAGAAIAANHTGVAETSGLDPMAPFPGPTAMAEGKTPAPSPASQTREPGALSRGTTRRPAPVPSTAAPAVLGTGSCDASFYDEPQLTATGETFDPDALTAAHRSLPFGSTVRVTNDRNGQSVVVTINDRGPYVDGRCLDLSRAAFAEIEALGAGWAPVSYEVLGQ